MSLRLLKDKYYVLEYWDREKRKRIQEYIGAHRNRAYSRLVEVIQDKISYWQQKLETAKSELTRNPGAQENPGKVRCVDCANLDRKQDPPFCQALASFLMWDVKEPRICELFKRKPVKKKKRRER